MNEKEEYDEIAAEAKRVISNKELEALFKETSKIKVIKFLSDLECSTECKILVAMASSTASEAVANTASNRYMQESLKHIHFLTELSRKHPEIKGEITNYLVGNIKDSLSELLKMIKEKEGDNHE